MAVGEARTYGIPGLDYRGTYRGLAGEDDFTGSGAGGLLATLLIGVIGAVIGGLLFNAMGRAGATGVDLYSIIVATLGAVLFLWIWKAVIARRPT